MARLKTLAIVLAGVSAAPMLAQEPLVAGAPDTTFPSLEQGFREPPAAARPQVWWHWMSGNVSAEGALLDLEWMHRVGIGGVHAFAGGGRLEETYVDKPLSFMSPGWRSAYRQAVARARALGIEVTIAGSPGWSQTGGPWVEPRDGMKKYVWSEVQVAGGAKAGVLPKPPVVPGPFQAAPRSKGFGPVLPFPPEYGDAAIFAFPTPAGEGLPAPRYTASAADVSALATAPADLSAAVRLPVPADGTRPYVDLDFGAQRLVRSLTVAGDPLPGFDVLVGDGSGRFRPLARVEKVGAEFPAPQHTFALPETRTQLLRVLFDRPGPARLLPGRPIPAKPTPPIAAITLNRLEANAAPRVDRFESKAGFQSVVDVEQRGATGPTGGAIDPRTVLDLSGRLRPDGTLDWTAPKGRDWTVVRLGWSLTGQVNNPAELSATGLEVDKLDPVAVKAYMAKLFSLYEKDAGVPIGKAGIGSLLTDSWEAGAQNWTVGLPERFAKLRGYPMASWLPVLTGRVVGDSRASDAFLFDFHCTLKDLLLTSHYAVLADAARAKGITYYTEAQGDAPRAIGDGLAAKALSDIPTAEYWYRQFSTDPGQPPLIADLAEAASAAHLHGKPLVAAEALTVAAGQDPWSFSPAMLKPVADEIFARGVNRMLLHDSHHQPDPARKPGLALGFFGQYFNRNETWAEQARPWVDYLARTSFLLQQGRAVADVLYFYGEEQNLTQRFEHGFNIDVPQGTPFDYVDAGSLASVVTVEDGRLVTPSGMNYRLLFLPAFVDRLTLPTLERIAQLVRDGAVLVGKRPVGGLGVTSTDAKVRAAVDRLWGEGDTPVHAFGKGRVLATSDLRSVLVSEGIAPDIDIPAGARLMGTHRRVGEGDVYFLSNRSDQPLRASVGLRATGTPQWWSAEDGRARPLSYVRDGAFTRVDLDLEGHGAGFVVFRPGGPERLEVAPARTVATATIAGPWQVSFEPGRGAPATARFPTLTDWSGNADTGIRYFSGGATYSRRITVDSTMVAPGRKLLLDLGQVHELAVVSLDGREIATAWKAPYRIDLTGKVTPGAHRLEIKVVNLWVNRLIGDRQPGAKPVTWAPQSPYKADSPLLPSGLIGPVMLVAQEEGVPAR
ncbi:hypothetical protein HNO88_002012 [Novosphingobium chloroacetimidivorans]|uniref:Glycoside hydrolase n=1 Tax=Novosphingobium chloroacetimidivorans TaxID=1428314 RepID=A0A7W7K9H6_9SPHN|nr:glycosyl hydrolase [Novosphingobium chloroacetimidivorans]MBB4858686.1 hypothetical protein [Novosphingobium chloroacetimidivorans]